MTSIRFVCATRARLSEFQDTALGKSLAMYQYPVASVRVFAENTQGLPAVYNTAIREAANDPAILVFVHDDIYLTDFFWPSRIFSALERFHVIGVAGNRRRVPRQPGWPFIDEEPTNDDQANLSGIVGHGGQFPCEKFSFYGAAGAEVKLLDGVLLAAHSVTLLSNEIRFDEAFKFHFYDMDFCRQVESKGLRMGTAELSILHLSEGNYRSPEWRAAFDTYLAKWKS